MAKKLTNIGIETGNTIQDFHVSQSIDAFTGVDEYDIYLSGSFNLTGSLTIDGLSDTPNSHILTFDISTNKVFTTSSIDFLNPLSSSFATSLSTISSSLTSSGNNFSNTDLTFTGDRFHNTDGNILQITTDNGAFGESWFVMNSTDPQIGSWMGYFDSYFRSFMDSNILDVRNNIIAQTPNLTTFNSASINVDVRFKGQSLDNILFIDASENSVSIGKTSPNTTLDILGDTTISGSLITSGSRVRNFRHIILTNADYSTSPTKGVEPNDDILLIDTSAIDSSPGAGSYNFNLSDLLVSSPAGRCIELVKISGSAGVYIGNNTMSGPELYLNGESDPDGIRFILSGSQNVGGHLTILALGSQFSGSAWGMGY
jgi:hypothetical protein